VRDKQYASFLDATVLAATRLDLSLVSSGASSFELDRQKPCTIEVERELRHHDVTHSTSSLDLARLLVAPFPL